MPYSIMSAEEIREQLLVATDERAADLRRYLEEEEIRRKSEELLDQRLQERVSGLSFSI